MPHMKDMEALQQIKDLQCTDQTHQEMPQVFLQKMIQNCWIERYKKGDYIIQQGDVGINFYIIIEGCAQQIMRNDAKAKALAELDLKLRVEEQNRKAHLKIAVFGAPR